MPEYFIHICKVCKGQVSYQKRDRQVYGWYCPNWREAEQHTGNFYGYLSPDGVEKVQVYSAEQFNERRQLDSLHLDARNLAIDNVRQRVVSALREMQDHNYGIAKSDLEHIITITDTDHGTCVVVEDIVNQLASRRGLT